MRYFIEDVVLYKPINKKWEDVQKFVTPIMQRMVANERSLDKLKEIITNHIEQMNLYYSRSKPLVLTVSRHLRGQMWRIVVRDDYEKVAAVIHIREVHGCIHLSLQDGETLEFSPDTDEESSANLVGIPPLPTL